MKQFAALPIFIASACVLAAEVDFAHQVVPVFEAHCKRCHLGEKQRGDFSMNTRESLLKGSENGAMLTPGKTGSRFIALLHSEDEDEQMPPEDRKRVPAKDIALLEQWIVEGAKWEPGFTFGESSYEPPLKPRRPELPPAVAGRDHAVDRILDAHLTATNQPRPAPLGDAAFMRRISLDLTGVLPSAEALQAFVADSSADKRQKLIAATLADDRAYADHWLSFWNDLLRNDYVGTGYIDGGRKPITDWLYSALSENKPYDEFARELLAPPSGSSAGFIEGIKWRGSVNASQETEVQFSQSISQTFLGLNMKCASCHDSFVDRWKLDEAYGLAAIIAKKPLEIARCDVPTGRVAKAAWIFPELGEVDADAPQPERLKQLAALMTHPENGRFTRTLVNRLWHRLMGRGIVHPVDAMDTAPWNEDLLDHLAVQFAEDGYDLKKALAYIATSHAYQSESVVLEDSGSDTVFRGPVAKKMTAEQFMDAVWTLTGTAPAAPHKSIPQPDAKPMVRAALVPSDLLMRALGRPNREQIVSMRPDNLTTLEAIDLANGEILADLLRRGAKTWSQAENSAADLIDSAFLRALSRPPGEAEKAALLAALGDQPKPQDIEDLFWLILLLPEFQFVR